MTIQPHDFLRPPSLHPETRVKLVQWLTRANSQLTEVIAGYSLKVEILLDDCSTAWPLASIQEWSEKSLAFRIKLADLSAVSAIALPNPLAQVLIGTLLGEPQEEWPVERDLTAGEQSVGEFLLSSVMSSLKDTWSGDEPPELSVVEQEPNLRRTKIFKYTEPFVVCRSTIRTEFGSAQWCWMLPHEFLSKLFGTIHTVSAASSLSARDQLESLAREMKTQIAIRLGAAQLSPPQLAELKIGDLVVLNQKTTEPLRAMVSGKPRFLGWPGRVGNRQAFEIASDGNRRGHPAEVARLTPEAVRQ